jgi:hypothetical protein
MLDITKARDLLRGIFDGTNGWILASAETCKRIGGNPNLLAYNDPTATLALLVMQGDRGFALGEIGLNYSSSALSNGKTRDNGAPVQSAIVVLCTRDKTIVDSSPVAKWVERQRNIPPIKSTKYQSDYWWVSPPARDDKIF